MTQYLYFTCELYRMSIFNTLHMLHSFHIQHLQEYKEGETTLDDALALAIRVMSKTMDATKLTPDKLELATLTRRDNKTIIKVLPISKVKELIAENEKKEEAEKSKPSTS